jgi:peroxiredoxin-like protein
MADFQHISRKGDKQFLFEVDLNWLVKQKGVLTIQDVAEKINVATPPLFGGEEKTWSPEHLFLSSLSSCFMTTFLAFAKNHELVFTGFECNTIGQVELKEGRFQFTRINIFPKIYVENENSKLKAKLVLEKTQKYCLVSNSINAEIIYHSEILVSSERSIAKSNGYAIL